MLAKPRPHDPQATIRSTPLQTFYSLAAVVPPWDTARAGARDTHVLGVFREATGPGACRRHRFVAVSIIATGANGLYQIHSRTVPGARGPCSPCTGLSDQGRPDHLLRVRCPDPMGPERDAGRRPTHPDALTDGAAPTGSRRAGTRDDVRSGSPKWRPVGNKSRAPGSDAGDHARTSSGPGALSRRAGVSACSDRRISVGCQPAAFRIRAARDGSS